MENVNDALKELYVFLGGDASTIKNGATVTDYVRLLKDVLGKPEDFVVTLTYSSGSYTADKTYEQISTAISSGKKVYLVDGKNIANLVGVLDDENINPTDSYISFKTSCGYLSSGDDIVTSLHYSVDSKNNWSKATLQETGI